MYELACDICNEDYPFDVLEKLPEPGNVKTWSRPMRVCKDCILVYGEGE